MLLVQRKKKILMSIQSEVKNFVENIYPLFSNSVLKLNRLTVTG